LVVLSGEILLVVSGTLPFTFSIGAVPGALSPVVVLSVPSEQENSKAVKMQTDIFFITLFGIVRFQILRQTISPLNFECGKYGNQIFFLNVDKLYSALKACGNSLKQGCE